MWLCGNQFTNYAFWLLYIVTIGCCSGTLDQRDTRDDLIWTLMMPWFPSVGKLSQSGSDRGQAAQIGLKFKVETLTKWISPSLVWSCYCMWPPFPDLTLLSFRVLIIPWLLLDTLFKKGATKWARAWLAAHQMPFSCYMHTACQVGCFSDICKCNMTVSFDIKYLN